MRDAGGARREQRGARPPRASGATSPRWRGRTATAATPHRRCGAAGGGHRQGGRADAAAATPPRHAREQQGVCAPARRRGRHPPQAPAPYAWCRPLAAGSRSPRTLRAAGAGWGGGRGHRSRAASPAPRLGVSRVSGARSTAACPARRAFTLSSTTSGPLTPVMERYSAPRRAAPRVKPPLPPPRGARGVAERGMRAQAGLRDVVALHGIDLHFLRHGVREEVHDGPGGVLPPQ